MSRRKVKENVEAEPELSADDHAEDEQVEDEVEESEPEVDPEPAPAPKPKKSAKLRKDGQIDRRQETALKNLEKARAVRAQRAKEAREARAAAAAAGEPVEEKKARKKKTTSHVVETVIQDDSDESESEFELVPVSKTKGGRSKIRDNGVQRTPAKVTTAATTPDQMQALMQMQKLWMQTMLQGQAPPVQKKKKRPTKIVTKVQVPASKPELYERSEHVASSPAKKEPAKVDPTEQLRKMMFG